MEVDEENNFFARYYFSTNPNSVQLHESYQIINSPQFIAFAIDRDAARLPLGGNITITVFDSIEYVFNI